MKLDRKQLLKIARLLAPIAKKHNVTLRALVALATDALPELRKHPELLKVPKDADEYLELAGIILDLA